MPVLYLDLQQAVDIGINFYGFNKHLTKMGVSSALWDVSAPATTKKLYTAESGAEEQLTGEGHRRFAAMFNSFQTHCSARRRTAP
jgi:hypothetical protein